MRSIFFWLALLQAGMLHAQDTLSLPPHTAATPVNSGEYFFDTDPGFGSGQPFSAAVTAAAPFISTESITALPAGVHQLHIRMRDAAGNWSMTNSRFLYILNPALTLPPGPEARSITMLEYFIGADPGTGNGTTLNISPALTTTVPNIPVDISSLGTGVYTIHLRARDSSGAWSQTMNSKVAIVSVNLSLPAAAVTDSIYTLEYFFDNDPGLGNGTLLTVPATTQLNNYTFPADISSLADGVHRLFVRTLRGRSLTAMHSFMIGQPLPLQLLAFDVKQQDGDALLSWKIADEAGIVMFIPESSTDGIHFQALDPVKAQHKNGSAYTCTDKHVGRYGATQLFYRLKIVAEDGGSGYTPVILLNLDTKRSIAYPNPFTDQIHILHGGMPDTGAPVNVRLTDISGRCVYKQQAGGSGVLTVSPGILPPGSYFITVEADHYKEVFNLTRK